MIKYLRSLFCNYRPGQKKILLTQKVIFVGSSCILLSGIGSGILYKEWQIQSQAQTQINQCYLVPASLLSAASIPEHAPEAR